MFAEFIKFIVRRKVFNRDSVICKAEITDYFFIRIPFNDISDSQ